MFIDASKTVSRAYATLGLGRHADLPGHSFILLDRDDVVRWGGDNPSMYAATGELLPEVARALQAQKANTAEPSRQQRTVYIASTHPAPSVGIGRRDRHGN